MAFFSRTFILVTLFMSCMGSLFSQGPSRMVKLIHADINYFDKELLPNGNFWTGNVELSHADARMFCDSAIFYQTNAFDAFQKVHIIKGDSIHIYGDSLYYNGNTKLAKLRGNVKLENINSELVLTTNYLDYDLGSDIGYYYNSGTVIDSSYTLTSERGYYFALTGMIHFKKDVVVVSENSRMVTDTMHFDSNSEIIAIKGPSTIYNDSVVLYSEDGWRDPNRQFSVLKKNSSIEKGGQKLSGEFMTFNGLTGFGEAFEYVEVSDTMQKVLIKGKYGYFDSAKDFSLVTDSAVFIQYSGFDSLYMHADTLTISLDTLGLRVFDAYRNVRFFRLDVQGKCDSLSYPTKDSLITMYYNPVLWAMFNQMRGKKIKVYNVDSHIERVEMDEKAFLISRYDSIRFNQIKGKRITGYLKNASLNKIFVDGSAESVYFFNDGPNIVGVNKQESPYLTIFMKGNEVEKLLMYPNPTGVFHAPSKISIQQSKLDGFNWQQKERPLFPRDIFRVPNASESKSKEVKDSKVPGPKIN